MWALGIGDRPWHYLVRVQWQRPTASSSQTEWQIKFIPVASLRETAIFIHQAVIKLSPHCNCMLYFETAKQSMFKVILACNEQLLDKSGLGSTCLLF